jgi:SAM-dependent methyltransferase
VARDRDVAAFARRAPGYEEGWRGRLHHEIADRTADLALRQAPEPRRVLDVGCGTGYLLRRLAARVPAATELSGVDAAAAMVEAARGASGGGRLSFRAGVAEHLPFTGAAFDLVVSTTSFDHWADQQVLVDLFSAWLLPTLRGERRDKARTRRRANRLLAGAGFGPPRWHGLYAVIIKAVTATR